MHLPVSIFTHLDFFTLTAFNRNCSGGHDCSEPDNILTVVTSPTPASPKHPPRRGGEERKTLACRTYLRQAHTSSPGCRRRLRTRGCHRGPRKRDDSWRAAVLGIRVSKNTLGVPELCTSFLAFIQILFLDILKMFSHLAVKEVALYANRSVKI